MKLALKEIFPTISLGNGFTFSSIIEKIYELKSCLEQRLTYAPTSPTEFKGGNQQKVVTISRLVDFKEDIIVTEEGEEEISIIKPK